MTQPDKIYDVLVIGAGPGGIIRALIRLWDRT